jgi:hypothetical protein
MSALFGSQNTATGGNSGSAGESQISHPVVLASSIGAVGKSGSAQTALNPSEKISGKQNLNKWAIPAASFAVVMAATGAIGSTGESTDKLYAKFLSRRLK